uniref:Uncharacterized protein n=1 Tax=Romanomermis culicivorax TaxID=13658 RepID=A0A915JVU4_ROMCU
MHGHRHDCLCAAMVQKLGMGKMDPYSNVRLVKEILKGNSRQKYNSKAYCLYTTPWLVVEPCRPGGGGRGRGGGGPPGGGGGGDATLAGGLCTCSGTMAAWFGCSCGCGTVGWWTGWRGPPTVWEMGLSCLMKFWRAAGPEPSFCLICRKIGFSQQIISRPSLATKAATEQTSIPPKSCETSSTQNRYL